MIVIVMIRMSAVPHDNDDDDSDDQNECGTSSLRSLSSPVASWKAPPPLTTPCGQHVTRRNQTCEHLSERSKIVFFVFQKIELKFNLNLMLEISMALCLSSPPLYPNLHFLNTAYNLSTHIYKSFFSNSSFHTRPTAARKKILKKCFQPVVMSLLISNL